MNKPKLLAAVLLSATIGCGGEGMTAPESCQTFPDISLGVGDTESVTPCFTDPTNTALVYVVESSNPDVADARIRGASVIIEAYGVGTATITITASNEDGSANVMITVNVPNRDPEVIAELPDTRLGVGWTSRHVVSGLFSEPDGQELSYSAESSSPSTVSADISGDTLMLRGLADGFATVSITASDGDGGTATTTVGVDVVIYTAVYEDDFNDDSGGWSRWRPRVVQGGDTVRIDTTDLAIRNGNLDVWGILDGWPRSGVALKSIDVTSWDIRYRVRPGADGTAVVLGSLHASDFGQLEIHICTCLGDNDYRVVVFDGRGSHEWALGSFGLESDHEWVDVRFWYENDQYHIEFNGGHRVSVGDVGSTSPRLLLLAFISDYTYDTKPASESRYVSMDWINVSSFGEGGGIAAADRTRRERIHR